MVISVIPADLVLGTLLTLSALQPIVAATYLADMLVSEDTISEAVGIIMATTVAIDDREGQSNIAEQLRRIVVTHFLHEWQHQCRTALQKLCRTATSCR
jgi:hypothetical protein